MVGQTILDAVNVKILDYEFSPQKRLVDAHGQYIIKFLSSKWADKYSNPAPLWISTTPPQTWGTATYVTPIAFPLSSGLYGRIGVVCAYDPTRWKIFDARDPYAEAAYLAWTMTQPEYTQSLLTVHSIQSNHDLRDRFRKNFKIDCILFYPDQAADKYTDRNMHTWMAVTDWNGADIATGNSTRFNNAKFTVLIDEEFELYKDGLPITHAPRMIEPHTNLMSRRSPAIGRPNTYSGSLSSAITDIINAYHADTFVHIYIQP